MCSFVVPDAKQFGIKKIQVDEQIGMNYGYLFILNVKLKAFKQFLFCVSGIFWKILPLTRDLSLACFRIPSDTGIRELGGVVQQMKTLSKPH